MPRLVEELQVLRAILHSLLYWPRLAMLSSVMTSVRPAQVELPSDYCSPQALPSNRSHRPNSPDTPASAPPAPSPAPSAPHPAP